MILSGAVLSVQLESYMDIHDSKIPARHAMISMTIWYVIVSDIVSYSIK